MKSGYIRFALLILAGITPAAQAIIYKVDVWKRRFAHGDNYVYCFSDIHLDYPDRKISDQQREHLLEAAQKMNAYCILEDPLCYQHADSEVYYSPRENFDVAPSDKIVRIDNQAAQKAVGESCPFGLAQMCKERNIAHESIEFRMTFIETAEKRKSIKQAFQEIIKPKINFLKKIGTLNDLKIFYLNKIQKMELDKHFEELDKANHSLDAAVSALKNGDKKIAHNDATIKKIIANKYMELLEPLFDCWILRALYKNHMQRTIFVVAGGDHIEVINSMLAQLGYTRETTRGNSINAEQPIIINSINIHDFFMRPITTSSWFSCKKLFIAGFLGLGAYLTYKFWKPGLNQLLQYRLHHN